MQRNIAFHCERSTLGRLACTHSTWTSASEVALYESISTCLDPLERCTVELLRMLAQQPGKAALVRSSSMSFSRDVNMRYARTRFGRSPVRLPEIVSLYCDVLVRLMNLTTMFCDRNTFYDAVLRIIRSGVFSLKSLSIPDEATQGGFTALDEALIPHAGTLRSIGLLYSYRGPLPGNSFGCLAQFADQYSTFALSNYADPLVSSCLHLYPILDASSPMWDTDLYVQNVRHALCNRDDMKGPKIIVTCLERLHSVVPRLLRHLAASFPTVASLSPSTLTLSLNMEEPAPIAWDNELTEDEERELLGHVATSCGSVHFVTLPIRNEYRYDPDAEDGWSLEYDYYEEYCAMISISAFTTGL
ncbi:hypothetical protein EXIGLDRAFT_746236 [Exidia glandulosa HHB12029]|uniref:Uncharacterized protein n=1 Tax=Exidia glandulosa HHB12029 TaxID=1314781 RepID=A0A165MHM0_EXIGL|nr:hypothetical protein EXIGLDRAFT_746236 [Exidia glandulosa HHB12029]